MPRFNVQTIGVHGASHVPSAAIIAYIDSTIHPPGHSLLSPSNIFLYHPDRLAEAISIRFPWIESAKIDRDSLLSTAISVDAKERTSFALWCLSPEASSTPCYEMDTSGFIFAPVTIDASSTRATLYVFTGGLPTEADRASPIGDIFAPGHFEHILSFLQYLSLDGFAPLGANAVSDTDFTVPLGSRLPDGNQGFYVKASFGDNPEDLVKNLQLILGSDALKGRQSELLYVDLRFGDRVYYKFKDQTSDNGSS
jgi:hypothetical protein